MPRRASVEPSDLSTAPPSVIPPAETPVAPTNLTAPKSGPATTSEISVAVDGALASLVALSPTGESCGRRGLARGAHRNSCVLCEQAVRAALGRRRRTDPSRARLARPADARGRGRPRSHRLRVARSTFADTRPERLAEIEATISAALVAYAMEASGSRIKPANLSNIVTASPSVVDPTKALSETASAAEPGDALAGYNPNQKGYQELRDELARLRASSPVAARRLPAGPTLRIGMEDPRVPLIRARFGLGAQTDPNGVRFYDARVATAVAAFQKSKGLAADGALTTATSEALFGDPNFRREAAIQANMEMWRWLPRDMGQSRIEINVADYMLACDERRRGSASRTRHRRQAGHADADLFERSQIYTRQSDLAGARFDHQEGNAAEVRQRSELLGQTRLPGQLRRRPSGREPAARRGQCARTNLVHVPERAFGLSARHAHPRTVRDHPARLQPRLRARGGTAAAGGIVMGGAARGWTAGRFQALLGTSEKAVFLPHPLPIHIEYFTEFVDAAGAAQEREDVYGLTAQVAATLSRLRQY